MKFGRAAVLAMMLVGHAGAATRPDAILCLTGLDVLQAQGFAPLWGKRVGVLVNNTSVNRSGRSLVELLRATGGITLNAIFTPEHGFSGKTEHGRFIEDTVYPGTSIPIYSLYGKNQRPTPEQLKNLDVLVFDIQDIGTRFYTYITTLAFAMEAAAEAKLEFYVLDRPNPLGGDVVEGEILSPSVRHFTAYYSIPVRHGMTVGELAHWHNAQASLGVKLLVLRVEGWRRSEMWSATDRKFVPPSPNIPSPRAALLYAGIGAFEATNVAVGRGTETPFEIFGAPWFPHRKLARLLNEAGLAGVRFRAVTFVPKKDRYQNQRCRGVRIYITNEKVVHPVDIFLHAVWGLRQLAPESFELRWAEIPRVTGSDQFQKLYQSGAPLKAVLEMTHQSASSFKSVRAPYLLYPEN